MADLTVSSSLVVTQPNAPFETGISGASLTAGMGAYLDPTDDRWKKAVATAQVTAAARGVITHNCSSGQPVRVQTAEEISLGGGITVGQTYIVSTNAGGICPIADLTTGSWVTHVGVGATTNAIDLTMYRSGVQKT
jgi:hypothetical protein